jgi:muramoyltetrapeptide carboxypeptidase
MCHALKTYEGNDTVSQALRGMLAGHLPTYRIAAHPLNITGKAEGIIVGGNMSVFNDLAGSDFDPLFIDGIVLFIEDTGEGMSKVDRMLHNIEIRGLQKHIRAVIVGQFNKYKHTENGFDDMYALLNEYLQHWHIPVCYNFPVGHAHLKNFPLLTGAKATLEVNPDEVVLDYNNSH